jgi:hypothetical protein
VAADALPRIPAAKSADSARYVTLISHLSPSLARNRAKAKINLLEPPVVTSKAAIDGRLKNGQRKKPEQVYL